MSQKFRNKISTGFILAAILLPLVLLILAPNFALALEMPKNGNDLAAMSNITAKAYIVTDLQTGQVLMDSNSSLPWVPASLTKLVTALVVLDAKVKLAKTVTMSKQDQIAGQCGSGGGCMKSAPGIKFTVDGLFHAALMLSANNAANALSRSTGLTPAQFVARMNAKALSLGAINTYFTEPTGMDPANTITAADYAKILSAAFSNSYLRGIAQSQTYALRSSNNTKYNQTIKNTDGLLADGNIQIIGAKTGYLDESLYNFAAVLTYNGGSKLAVVVLGEEHLYSAFADTDTLAGLAELAQSLAYAPGNPAK